jgi:hypothetical protein
MIRTTVWYSATATAAVLLAFLLALSGSAGALFPGQIATLSMSGFGLLQVAVVARATTGLSPDAGTSRPSGLLRELSGHAGCAFAMGVVTTAAAFAVVIATVSPTESMWTPELVRVISGAGFYLAALAVSSAALRGAWGRTPAVTVIAVACVIVPTMLVTLPVRGAALLASYLPFGLLPGTAGRTIVELRPTPDQLPLSTCVLVLALWTTAIAVAVVWTSAWVRHRDGVSTTRSPTWRSGSAGSASPNQAP